MAAPTTTTTPRLRPRYLVLDNFTLFAYSAAADRTERCASPWLLSLLPPTTPAAALPAQDDWLQPYTPRWYLVLDNFTLFVYSTAAGRT